MERLVSFFGLFVLLGIAWLLSDQKKQVNWRTVGVGLFLQIALGVLVLKTTPGQAFFEIGRNLFTSILAYADVGASFLFGPLADREKMGMVIFTMVLPSIILTSALLALLYHMGIMTWLVKGSAWVMVRTMGTSGAESLATAANIFSGQTEAPLVIKPFLNKMTRSELMALMTGGMATVAGGVLVAYVGMGIDGGHLLAASVMSAPAALVCAKLMVPENESSITHGGIDIKLEKDSVNLLDAATKGTIDGTKLAINVAAMLIAFISLIALLNWPLNQLGELFGLPELSLEWIAGRLFSPLAFCIGVPWSESIAVGELLGKKLILNEFVAYLDLKQMIETNRLSERSIVITTYALCGFANFSSVAIQVGGIGAIAPSRRKDLAQLGFKSLVAGTLACLMTACVAGMLLS